MANEVRTIVVDEEPTIKYFNNLAAATGDVSSDVNTTIIGYFEPITTDKDSAKILAQAVMQTAFSLGLNPLDVLEEFKKKTPGELTAFTTMFLNVNRIGTSFLGITNSPFTSDYIRRAILP